jgi:hypothetical protein
MTDAPRAPESASGSFDACFLEHPAFEIFEHSVRERLAAHEHFPAPSELRALAADIPVARGLEFAFELEDSARVREAGGFDRFIAETARIPTRSGSYHDLFGALIWLHFPLLKRALHRLQLQQGAPARSPAQNAATHFDESGVLVVSSDERVFQGLVDLNWSEVLWQRRAALRETTRFLCFGHGLLDALRVPHPKILGMALFVRASVAQLKLTPSELRIRLDQKLSGCLAEALAEPGDLRPLPVLGIPRWANAQTAAFYDDEQYFRRARHKPRAAAVATWVEL